MATKEPLRLYVVVRYRPKRFEGVSKKQTKAFKERWPLGLVFARTPNIHLNDFSGFDWRAATPDEEAAWRLGAYPKP